MSKLAKILNAKLSIVLPRDVYILLDDELRSFEKLSPGSPEYESLKSYLEWVSELPWKSETKDRINLTKVSAILDREHVGRKDLKEKIKEYFAVAELQRSFKGNIFCFVGPPGVGKRHLATTLAKCLGRKTIEFHLREVDSEEALKGRKRGGPIPTPGKLLQALRALSSKNPVLVFRNMDLLPRDWSSQLISNFLELFDSQKNSYFTDRYLGLPFDLSRIFFMMTALDRDDIPESIQEKMQIFQLNAYTPEEKIEILKQHLFDQECRRAGFEPSRLKMSDEVLLTLINHYTREAGVHRLQSMLGSICRYTAKKIIESQRKSYEFTTEDLVKVFGPARYFAQLRESQARKGVATALSWTPHGGDILFIEVSVMPGAGKLFITGQIGSVMQESARIAVSWMRSHAKRFGLNIQIADQDIHIHVPYGAAQKDGPSAGIAILSALFSWFLDKPIDPRIAMTGEITLRGAVVRVGGIKEKIIAAHRAGIQRVVISKSNENDISQVAEEIRSQLSFKFVESIEEVVEAVLGLCALPRVPQTSESSSQLLPL